MLPKKAFHWYYIFRACIEYSHFPERWKKAKIVPIKWVKKTPNFVNYRQISLLPMLGKVLQKLIAKAINDILDGQKLLLLKCEFKAEYTITRQLLGIMDTITRNFNLSKPYTILHGIWYSLAGRLDTQYYPAGHTEQVFQVKINETDLDSKGQ